MKKILVCMSAMALVSTLSACSGTSEPANEVVAIDMNSMAADPSNPSPQSNLGDSVAVAPAAPAAPPTVTPTARPAESKAAAPKPAAPKLAPAKAAPKPKPPELKAAEPKAPDTSCLPEHRAAGHC